MTGDVIERNGDVDEGALRTWMRVVGAFYILLGVRLLPWFNAPMVERFGDLASPGVVLEPGTPVFSFVIDWMATFGLDLVVLGVVLMLAARRAWDHRILAYVVIGQEAVRGILADVWFAARPFNSTSFYLGFLVVHAAVIATGVWALRRAAGAGTASIRPRPAPGG